jgi:hypothetical protein
MPTRAEIRRELKERIGILVRALGDDTLQPHETEEYDHYLDGVIERADRQIINALGPQFQTDALALVTLDTEGKAKLPKMFVVVYEVWELDSGGRPVRRLERLRHDEFWTSAPKVVSGPLKYWMVWDGQVWCLPPQGVQVGLVGKKRATLVPILPEDGVVYTSGIDVEQFEVEGLVTECLVMRSIAEWLLDIGKFDLARMYLERSLAMQDQLKTRSNFEQAIVKRPAKYL